MSRIRLIDTDMLSEVWAVISRNKRRSLLTAFGVFWGVFMLVVMLSMGKGICEGIFGSLDMIPRNMTICWTERTTIPYQGFRKGRWWDLKEEDIAELKAKVPEVETFAPVVSIWNKSVTVVNGDKTGEYSIRGVSASHATAFPINIVEGRYFNDSDIAQCRKVVVLGKEIVNEIFYGKAPIGQYIKCGGVNYMVIGVVSQKTDNFNIGSEEDKTVSIPYTLAQRIYNWGTSVSMIMMVGREDVPIASIEDKIGAILRSRHQVSPDDKPALRCMNLDEMLQVFRMLILGINILIWIVGVGTLLSGAIGVSNIVMITVKERTREIGVRRALGARPSDITLQIVCESVILTLVAGLCGLVCGVGLMAVICNMPDLSLGGGDMKLVDPMINFSAAVTATAVIVATGVLASLLPARKAMKVKAIDAIKEE